MHEERLGAPVKKAVIGVVTSARTQKTIAVRSERLVRHPRYGKYVKRYTTYRAHDPESEAKLGDLVELVECRPLSRTKRWRLENVLRRAVV